MVPTKNLWPAFARRGSPPDELPFGLSRDCCAFPKGARRGDSTSSRCDTQSRPACCASNQTFNHTVFLKCKTFTALSVLRLLSLHLILLSERTSQHIVFQLRDRGLVVTLEQYFFVHPHSLLAPLYRNVEVYTIVFMCSHTQNRIGSHSCPVSQDSDMCNTSVRQLIGGIRCAGYQGVLTPHCSEKLRAF